MNKKEVIIITGVPGVGKTTIARKLSEVLNAKLVEISSLIEKYCIEKDEIRDTLVVDEEKLLKNIESIVRNSKERYVIVEGHLAHLINPKLVTHYFILKLDPNELYKRLKQRGYQFNKIFENIWAQNLEIIESELEELGVKDYLIIDTTNKTPEDVVKEILEKMKD